MKIIIATPLYPPEISGTATYVKELAKHLSGKHEVIIVAYGHIPEKVNGVKIYTINKNRPIFIRLVAYTLSLWQIYRGVDIIYSQNGASVELPIIIVSIFTGIPIVFSISDIMAHERASRGGILGFIENLALKKSVSIVKNFPIKKPIIYPFEPKNKNEWDKYESSWTEHINSLEKIFKNGRKI